MEQNTNREVQAPAATGAPKKSGDKRRRIPEILRYSEIRDGRFIRYFGKRTEICVPDFVRAIDANAFRGNKKITDVHLGANVSVIGAGAFDGCTSLRRVTFPDTLRSIGAHAFRGCSSLTSLLLPAGLRVIDEG